MPDVVALRPLWLGDLLTGIPALRALRDGFPGHRIVLAAPRALEPLARLSGAVDEVVTTRPLEPLPAVLHGADVAVDLHGRGPASHRILLAARPRRLVAWRNREVPESDGMPEWCEEEHEVKRWCRLLTESGIPADPSRLDLPRPEVAVPAGAAGATIVHPGAKSAARRWPLDRFAAVARAELASGRRVVVTGSGAERPLALALAERARVPEHDVLAGRTGLLGLAALVQAAGRIVCGDTGLAHVATAFATPSVVLFGPTPPALWGPPPSRLRHVALWSGRRGDPHGAEADPGLIELDVGTVLAALARLDSTKEAT